MPTSAATVPVRASRQSSLSSLRNWLQSTTGPTRSSVTVIQRRIRLVPATSSDQVRAYRRASALSRAAYDASPTAVACTRPRPATTMDPDRTSSPGPLGTGSDSPVSRASSTVSPADDRTTPSTGTWSPAVIVTRSSEHHGRDGHVLFGSRPARPGHEGC